MNESQLILLLESLTGHLQPSSERQQAELLRVQELLASSLRFTDDNGGEQIFGNSDLYSRELIGSEKRKSIAAIASRVAQQPAEDNFRAFMRSVPIRNPQIEGSVPVWAAGAKVAETYGPFINNEGREIWVDIYRIVKLVTLYYGSQPFLIFKASIMRRPVLPPQNNLSGTYEIVSGPVWINASLFLSSVPINRFVGFNVQTGTIKLSELPTLQAGKITLNPNATIDCALQLINSVDDGAADTGAYGIDARRANYQMPETLGFSWNGAAKKVTSMKIGEAAAKIYGQELKFNFTALSNPVLSYENQLNQLIIPWVCSTTSFTVSDCQSPFMTISGVAPIVRSFWSLPTAIIDPAAPLEAEGSGAVLLLCGPGLRAVWRGLENEDLRLLNPLIYGSPGNLSLLDFTANAQGASQHFDLWKDEQRPYRSGADLQFLKTTPFLFTSASSGGQEFLTTACNADFKTDRPVRVNGESFEIRSKASLLMLGASDGRKLIYLYDDNIMADNTPKSTLAAPIQKKEAIALQNALFTVSQVNTCMLFGECDENFRRVTRANLFISFILYRYLPTLPDPYVGDLSRWERLFGRNDGAGRAAVAQGSPLNMLICAVRYSRVDEENDAVKVGFHFGALSAESIADLPETGQNRAVAMLRNIGRIKTTRKLTALNIEQLTATNSAFMTRLQLKGDEAFNIRSESPVLTTTATGQALTNAINIANRSMEYEDLWNNSLFGNRLEAEPLALLDVSSRAHLMGISVSGQQIIVKTGNVVAGRENEAAIVNTSFPFIVDGMQVKAPGTLVRAFTVPQISWEPVINRTPPDRDNPNDLTQPKLPMDPEAGPIYFPNDGGATRIWNNNTRPVSLAPIPFITSLLLEFRINPQNFTVASFTLPFGIKAISYVSKNFIEPVKPDIVALSPKFRENAPGRTLLEGGIQLSFRAGQFSKSDPDPAKMDSTMFPGYMIQYNNLLDPSGKPSGASNLGHRVTQIVNNEFLTNALTQPVLIEKSRGVPVSRIDITGYGANMFSDWLSPTAAMAQTSQVKFDVMHGRTAHEVVQVKSILYPWGIRVVRTITLFRAANGYVNRTDSGWKAESDGLFDFSYKYQLINTPDFTTDPAHFKTEEGPYEFHPGVVRGLFNIRNIKDAPSVKPFESFNDIGAGEDYLNGVKGRMEKNGPGDFTEAVYCGGVYFDADVEIENVVQGHNNERVASKKILGFVQVAPAGKPLSVDQLRALLGEQNNSIGGDIDCVTDINKSDQQMRLNRFDVNNSLDASNKPVFVIAARGNVILPKDGSWSMVQHNAGSGEVTPLPEGITVPLIRSGKWVKQLVVNPQDIKKSFLRIAHPSEILRNPASSTINFGYLQTTATQKALFLTPAYALDTKSLLSKTPPVFADAYRLMTGNGIFPNIGNAIDNFGKALPLLNGIDGAGNLVKAFATKTLEGGAEAALEIMMIQAEKAGETVINQGMSMLKKGANGLLDKALKFDIPEGEVPLVDTKGLRIYIEYKAGKNKEAEVPSKVDFDVESFAGEMGKQWKSRLNNLAMVVDLGDMKRLMTIKGNFDAKKGKETSYEGGEGAGDGLEYPEIQFNEKMQPLIDLLTVLGELSAGDYGAAMKKGLKIAMSNSGEIWEYKYEAAKELPLIRFPPTDELYNSAQTPLKLEASLSLGVYFNAALKVTTDPKQLLPTAGAFLKFHGGLSVMCLSVGVGSIYAIGSVDVKIACDTKVGPNLTLDFGFGVQIVVSLPVVGRASITFMVGVSMYADKDKLIITAMMLFRGNAELLGGLVSVTITIEAKGIVEKSAKGTEASAQVTFALDISIFLIIDISFSKTWGEDRQIA